MTGQRRDIERRAALASVDLEAVIAVVTTTVGAMFGPVGAIAGAFVGPYAKHAATRLIELRSRVEEAGVDSETLVGRLDENEALAHLIAEVVRGTVDSDLAAKRALLARAAIRALENDSVVDIEQRIVRTANQVDTVDIRLLALLCKPTPERRESASVTAEELVSRWPGVADVVSGTTSSLIAAGLIKTGSPGTLRPRMSWKPTSYGRLFLERLQSEGLDDELLARGSADADR